VQLDLKYQWLLWQGITSLGIVTANSGGNFTLDINLLAGAVHNIAAQATDTAGNVSDVSAVLPDSKLVFGLMVKVLLSVPPMVMLVQ
jgi:hypothetical protein